MYRLKASSTPGSPRFTALLEPVRRAYRAAAPVHRLRRYIGDAADIRTYTSVNERLCLFEEALAALRSPRATGTLLEIGSYLGASAAVLAEALRWTGRGEHGKLYCLDTWHNDAMTEGRRATEATFCEHTARWQSLITMIQGHSHEVALPSLPAVDLVFIDGDHSYEGARGDIARFAPLVAPDGRLVLHDHRSKAGVARALGELLRDGQWVIHRCVESLVSLRRAPWANGETCTA